MNRIYLVTYDLRGSGRSYTDLYAKLRTYKSSRPAQSVWFVVSGKDAVTIRDELLSQCSPGDTVLVVEILTGSAASWGAASVDRACIDWMHTNI